MIRIAIGFVIAGLGFAAAYYDDPEYYRHDVMVPITTTAVTSTTDAVVVGPPTASQAAPTTSTTVTATTRPFRTVPDTSVEGPFNAKCPEWWGFAAKWFDADELETVDQIIWAESRCQPDVVGNGGYGLMQIQWSVWGDTINAQGFHREDLFDPSVNIMWGFLIAHEAERIGWCTFQPWYMSGDWCS